LAQLAAEITLGKSNAYDRAAAIDEYLKKTYSYTLELPSQTPVDPLGNFLFDRKKGHCEYFASAMAIMLRTQGIPSRVVNGFRGGEFNDLTGSYIVRARQAHSWVEAFFPGYGWVTFDPTPAATLAMNFNSSRYALYMDAMSEFWREWVINYDYNHQENLGQQVISGARDEANNLSDWIRERYEMLVKMADDTRNGNGDAPQTWKYYGAAALSVILLLVNGRRVIRSLRQRRIAGKPGRSPKAAATIWYERMAHTVGRRGWSKLPTQTPQEFVFTIEDPGMRASVEAFTRRYERARFGESTEDAEALPSLFEEIKRSGR
jgi:protein-glutamine gamma-glutamyltransferase